MDLDQAAIAKEQAERLRQVGELSPECFRQLAENVSDVFYILDLQSPRMMYVSPAYEKLWARPVGSLYEQPDSWLLVVHPEDRPRVAELGNPERYLSWDMEYRVLRADGSVRWISDRAFPVRDSRGVPYRIAGIARDITEGKQAEILTLRAKEEAERMSLAKGALLANMSHELVTPLNSVIGFSELLAEGAAGDLNETQARYVGHIAVSGRRLLSLVNDVIDLAKIEAGHMQLELQATDLGALLVEIAQPLANQVRDRGIVLCAEAEPGLPAAEVDPLRLRQVVTSLLGNALKFTPEGGAIRLRAAAWHGASLAGRPAVLVTVADTGIGIAHGDRERVFDAFEQLDASYGRRQEGSGLGLALARRLIELHGGRIWVDSPGPGLGSTFSLLVPVAPANPTAGSAPAGSS
jgi:PAS domain S-box-containing protein